MKINLLNKLYITIAVCWIAGMAYNIISYKSWDRYYYFSSASSPATYPVYIRECYFITEGDEDAWIKDEDVNRFNSRWGDEYYFAETNEKQRLPEKLVIQYASYRDSKFYSDTVLLPTEKIRKIFDLAIKDRKTDEIYSNGKNNMGLRFVVGIANNGNIAVWLRGIALEETILKTKIYAAEPTGDATYYRKRLDKASYLKEVFEFLPDSLKTEFKNGVDAGANYIDSPTHYIDNNRETWKQKK